MGAAFYQRAEFHRLRGDFERAEAAYRRANELGREPQPGLALLRLAQGQAVRRRRDPPGVRRGAGSDRAGAVLGAYVEIVLASGDVPAARRRPTSYRRWPPSWTRRSLRARL